MRRVAKIREQARGKRKGYRSKGSRDEKCPEKCPEKCREQGKEERKEQANCCVGCNVFIPKDSQEILHVLSSKVRLSIANLSV